MVEPGRAQDRWEFSVHEIGCSPLGLQSAAINSATHARSSAQLRSLVLCELMKEKRAHQQSTALTSAPQGSAASGGCAVQPACGHDIGERERERERERKKERKKERKQEHMKETERKRERERESAKLQASGTAILNCN